MSTYTLNNVLDEKRGKKSKQQRNNECIASMVQREIAQELLRNSGVSAEQFFRIDRYFSEINKITSGVGQYLDGNELRQVNKDYLKTYIARCEGLAGRFMQNIGQIGTVLAGANEKEIHCLGEFGRNYGIILQIVNDLGDFLPPQVRQQSVGKVYQDQFSDLRHGCITFPASHIILHQDKEGMKAVERVKGNLDASLEDCTEVTRAFLRAGGLKAVKELAKPYAQRGKESLAVFPKSLARDFLSTSLSVYATNKYYISLRGIGTFEG